jgi:hypothetical protein
MSKFKIGIAVVVLAAALSAASYAAPAKTAARGGGATPHGGGSVAHVSAQPAVSRSASPAISRSSAQPSFHANINRGNVSHAATRTTFRGNRTSAVHNTSNTSVNRAAVVHSDRSTNANRNANANRITNANRSTARTTNLNANVRSTAVRNTLRSHTVAGALSNRSALRNASTRAGITASAATAGLHNGRGGGNGWWRHRNGGYGWVGPLFWPFAYYDMYDYAMWGGGYDDSFWGYGYDDLYAGLFAPYGYDDLAGYLPQDAGTNASATNAGGPATTASVPPQAASADTGQLAQMCGEDGRDIAGLPIDQLQQAIQPNDAQRAALDELGDASVKAAHDIKTACPTDIALTAPSRLAAMQQRIEAMIAAVNTVQPPLEKFYGLLSDEQKERLTALAHDQRQSAPANNGGPLVQTCGTAQSGVIAWPTAEIDRTVRPTAAQHASLVALQNATANAADMLKASCQANDALTPPARLAAVGKRLDAMLQAVKTVRSALDDFYGQLSDEQKASFEAIGPQRTSQADQPAPGQARYHRRGIGVGSVIRQMLRTF